MANLTIQSPRQYWVGPAIYIDYPVTAASVYEGSALGDIGSAGGDVNFANVDPGTNIVGNLVGGANFVGFANSTYTYNSVMYVSGTTTISVIAEGYVVLTVAGLTSSSLGEFVYATDGNTFSVISAEYQNDSTIGRVTQIISVSAGTALVHFQGAGVRSI
jgi:carbon monoxide dehydrogenase subunit G